MIARNITITPEILRPLVLHRKDTGHKGDYGHLLIIAGCQSMPGAAVLAAGAALKSGCGLVTLHSTSRALQAAVNLFPSAMLSEDPGSCFSATHLPLSKYSAIAAGPGLGQAPQTTGALAHLLSASKDEGIPMVLDADALNIIAANRRMTDSIPEGSVLTPHLGELRRLLPGLDDSNFEGCVSDFSAKTGCITVVKGFHTQIYTPDGICYVNSTGNPGMAKGGSGDVLTGLTGGLIARGYSSRDAALLAVWIHGCAGDVLSKRYTQEAYNSLDLIGHIWTGFDILINSSFSS